MKNEENTFLEALDERLEELTELMDSFKSFYHEDRIEQIACELAQHISWDIAHNACENIITSFSDRLDELFQSHDLDLGENTA